MTPEFEHIHCSSRYDRSPESLEEDLDKWQDMAPLITLTEVSGESRAAKMREKGWDHFRAKKGDGADNCAIMWDKSVWLRQYGAVRKLHSHRFLRPIQGSPAGYVHAATVILKHKDSGQRLMVTIAHMPHHVETKTGFLESGFDWRARKTAYIESMSTWSTWVHGLTERRDVQAVLVVADWNISLKDGWFRQFLRDHWGKMYKLTWKHFPTNGSSLSAHQGRIIDASLVRRLNIVEGATLMPRTRSTDHTPYKERLGFTSGQVEDDGDDEPTGDKHKGRAWWGFEDYLDDNEIFQMERVSDD